MDWHSVGPKYTTLEIWFCKFQVIRKRSKSIWAMSPDVGIWFKILDSDLDIFKHNKSLVIEDWRETN